MDKMTITVKIKSVYGNELVYPVCEQAMRFCMLTETKTLTSRHITVIKSLGYTIAVQAQTL